MPTKDTKTTKTVSNPVFLTAAEQRANPYPVPRTQYDRVRVPTVVEGASMTQQHMADSVNINKIMDRYLRTGEFPDVQEEHLSFYDVPAQSYHEMMNTLARGEEAFNALPAQFRKNWDNDPVAFLRDLQEPSGAELRLKLGIDSGKGTAPSEKTPPAAAEGVSGDSGSDSEASTPAD